MVSGCEPTPQNSNGSKSIKQNTLVLHIGFRILFDCLCLRKAHKRLNSLGVTTYVTSWLCHILVHLHACFKIAMIDSNQITAEQFIEQRADLPDMGRWSELVQGSISNWQGPDDDHGTIVLNLAKAIADFQQSSANYTTTPKGFASFDAALLVQRQPDTVRYPPLCWFEGEAGFSLLDQPLIEMPPASIFEIASTNDRRREMPERIQSYLDWGVETIWLIDPHETVVHRFSTRLVKCRLTGQDTLSGLASMSGFEIQVARIFQPPDWWTQ